VDEAHLTPLGAVARGLAAGVAGTAVMTAYQGLVAKLESARADESGDAWENAPAPAKVAKRIIEGLFHREVDAEKIPLLTSVMHWAYGTLWGAGYALLAERVDGSPAARGLAFGTGVWVTSYAQLVPLGIYSPPWEYDAKTLATDLSYHLVYGLGVSYAYEPLRNLRL
jgi:hypothetical protein